MPIKNILLFILFNEKEKEVFIKSGGNGKFKIWGGANIMSGEGANMKSVGEGQI